MNIKSTNERASDYIRGKILQIQMEKGCNKSTAFKIIQCKLENK